MRKTDENGLTAYQEAFAQAYIECGEYSEAYRRAGYSTKGMKPASINRVAYRTAHHPAVSARIRELQAAAAERNNIEADEVLQGYAAAAFVDRTRIFQYRKGEFELADFDTLTDAERSVILGVKVKRRVMGRGENEYILEEIEVKTEDKQAARDSLSKHLGLFKADNAQRADASLAALYEAVQGRTRGLPCEREGAEAGNG